MLFAAELALGADAPSLVKRARELGLGESRGWLVLLHYRQTFAGRESAIDAPGFFLSPDGKHDPEGELDATIEALFADNSSKSQGENPLCRYPARKRFLAESLGLSAEDFSKAECADYDSYMGRVAPHSASLIFATAHMNSPASMFGHTLLRVDPDVKSKILGYAVNYAAEVDKSDSGPTFAAKGLLGLYPGRFSLLPYWDKIGEYGAMEQRDVWEYRLNLTSDEVLRMTEHIWELRENYSDYFFLDENCSYNILFLLEAARPSVSLTAGHGWWVIPLDTLKDVIGQKLVEDFSFRPSPARKIAAAAKVLSPDAMNLAKELSEADADSSAIQRYTLPPEQKALALEVAAEFTQKDYLNHKIELGAYKKKLFELTTERSKLGKLDEIRVEVLPPAPPQLAHDSARLKIGWGREGGEDFGELSLRSAYHDLSDPAIGFPEGSQIQFPWVSARFYGGSGRARVWEAGLLDIRSLSAIDDFFKPISWRFKTGALRRPVGDGLELAPYAEGGGGVTLGFGDKRHLMWFMTEARGYLEGDGDFRAGPGAEAGILISEGTRFKTVIRAEGFYYPDAEGTPDLELSLVQSAALSQNSSLSLSLARLARAGAFYNEALFSLSLYF